MEFLLFLTPIGHQIYELASKKVDFAENHSICQQYDIMGFYKSKENLMIVCTDTIKRVAPYDTGHYIQETILHESVHVAQDCKAKVDGNNHWFSPFNINKDHMKLNSRRSDDLEKTAAMIPQNRQIEHEAFWMEDKPEKVKYVLEKYCF